jgi:hypothetical protein
MLFLLLGEPLLQNCRTLLLRIDGNGLRDKDNKDRGQSSRDKPSQKSHLVGFIGHHDAPSLPASRRIARS